MAEHLTICVTGIYIVPYEKKLRAAECRAERPDVATIGGPSWVVNPTVGDEGRHGRPLHVEWASPRPMLEVKLGLGILEDESMDAPSSFE